MDKKMDIDKSIDLKDPQALKEATLMAITASRVAMDDAEAGMNESLKDGTQVKEPIITLTSRISIVTGVPTDLAELICHVFYCNPDLYEIVERTFPMYCVRAQIKEHWENTGEIDINLGFTVKGPEKPEEKNNS